MCPLVSGAAQTHFREKAEPLDRGSSRQPSGCPPVAPARESMASAVRVAQTRTPAQSTRVPPREPRGPAAPFPSGLAPRRNEVRSERRLALARWQRRLRDRSRQCSLSAAPALWLSILAELQRWRR